MSSFTDSHINPKLLRNLPDNIDLNQKNEMGDFFDLLAWFRGDPRIGTSSGVATVITASQIVTFTIGPPDLSEEWEIFAGCVFDTAHIDPNDQVEWTFFDNISGIEVPLQQSKMAGSIRQPYNQCVYPARDVAFPIISMQNPPTLVLKKKDNATNGLVLVVTYASTATVGSRAVFVNYIYRRRTIG